MPVSAEALAVLAAVANNRRIEFQTRFTF